MGVQDSLGQRITHVRWLVGVQRVTRQPSQGEFGELVGHSIRREAFSASAVGQWEAGKQVPDLATLAAIARLVGADPGWLGFGLLSSAEGPPTWLALGPVPTSSGGDAAATEASTVDVLEGDQKAGRAGARPRPRPAKKAPRRRASGD